MLVRQLSAYDVSPKIIEAFRAAVGESLLPAQELAVREGLLSCAPEGRGQNLLIAAPTSAGKTFIGEMAAIHAAQRGQRVLYLVPLKAMAEEAYRSFGARYQCLDLSVVISTRDHREFDARIESGEFHVAIVVYEKLHSLLVSRPELLGKAGLIVVDELHLLCDQGRGPKLELLLTKIRRAQRGASVDGVAPGGPQLICLSAPMTGLVDLGSWLGAHVVIDERRPVELRAGVVHRGRFIYRSSRSGLVAPAGQSTLEGTGLHDDPPYSEEDLYGDSDRPNHDGREARDVGRQVQRTVRALCERDEQTLVFLPDKSRCVEAARELRAALDTTTAPAAWAMDEIGGTDPGQAREALMYTLARGVAFHNSDLTSAQRDIIEKAFRRGEVRVLCATSTLAMGVNLPAKNVVLAERWKWRYSRRYNKWVRDDLNKVEYDGMSGRAGRLGLGQGEATAPTAAQRKGGAKAGESVGSFGRSLLIAPSRFDAEVWMRTLVCGPVQELEPTLLGKPLGDVVLDVVAASLCRDEAEVVDFLLSTFTGHLRWSRSPGQQAFAASVALTIEDLLRNDLLLREETGELRITAVGRVCARKGLMVRSAVLLSRWADAASPPDVHYTPLEVLLVCALTPDGGEAHVPLSLPEHRFGDYWTRILLKAQETGAADRRIFRWLRDQRGRLTYEQTKSIKKALLLLDWVDSHDSAEIEREHSVWSGAVSHAAADFAWLVEALRETCDARGWSSQRTDELSRLAERLRYGVTDNLLPLARAATPILSRSHIQRVAAAGLNTEEGLYGADEKTLEQALGHRGILQKIYQIQAARLAQRNAEAAGRSALPTAKTAMQKEAPPGRVVAWPSGQPIEQMNTQEVAAGQPAAAQRPPEALVADPAPLATAPAAARSDDALIHPEVDQAAVELGEPGHGARKVVTTRANTPEGADLPLDQVLVGGTPAGAGAPAQLAMQLPFIDPETLEAATAGTVLSGLVPTLRPVIVRRRTTETVAQARRKAPTQVVLSPEAGPRRCYLLLDDQRVAVSPGSFALLTRLALGSVGPVGWVGKDELGKSSNGVRKSISRLRSELRRVDVEARFWIENDGRGSYRLSLSAPALVLDKEALRRHPLATIRAALRAA